jgi:hypothetical protein
VINQTRTLAVQENALSLILSKKILRSRARLMRAAHYNDPDRLKSAKTAQNDLPPSQNRKNPRHPVPKSPQ